MPAALRELLAPEYLADLMTAFEYTDAAVVGKLAHYVHLRSDQANLLRFASREHINPPGTG